jgi:hypothetical protein
VAPRAGSPLAAFRCAMSHAGKVRGVLHGSVRLLSHIRVKNTRIELSHRATYPTASTRRTPFDARIDAGATPAHSQTFCP